MNTLKLHTSLETVTYSSADYDSLGNERGIPETSGYGNLIPVEFEVEGRDICTIKIGELRFTKEQLEDLITFAAAHEEANKVFLHAME